MKFRVLVNKQFGEGWMAGDIVDMDWEAAEKRVELGHIELVKEDESDVAVVQTNTVEETKEEKPVEEKVSTFKEVAIENLETAKDILDGLKLRHWLAFGTCLGAYRDGDFCPGDEDDIDIGLHIDSYAYADEIVNEFISKQFVLYNAWEPADGIAPEISFVREYRGKKMKVDLFFFTPNPANRDEVIFRLYNGFDAKNYVTKAIAASHFKKFRDVQLFGKKYKIPYSVRQYLTENYGDFETRVPRNEWNWLTSNHARTL